MHGRPYVESDSINGTRFQRCGQQRITPMRKLDDIQELGNSSGEIMLRFFFPKLLPIFLTKADENVYR